MPGQLVQIRTNQNNRSMRLEASQGAWNHLKKVGCVVEIIIKLGAFSGTS
jgi:hypothetical protein